MPTQISSGAVLGALGAKFGRKFVLTIYPEYKLVDGKYVLLDEQKSDILVLKNPFTLQFSISRDVMQSANSANLRIFNLNQDTRNKIYKDPWSNWIFRPVMLQAGYAEPLPIIFKGNLLQATSFREEGSVDFITELRCLDYAFAMSNAWSNWTVSEPTTKKQDVIDRLIGDLAGHQVTRGVVSSYDGEYARGYTVCSPTWEALQKETDKTCFIDNGEVNCIQNDEGFEGVLDIIDSETGLLGSPKRSQSGVSFDMIFEPRLAVGNIVQLNSRAMVNLSKNSNFNGQYLVIGISHNGVISDAVSGKCKTTVQLKLPDTVAKNLNAVMV